MIAQLTKEFEDIKKERDSEIEILKSKVDGIQKQADLMLTQKTTEAQKTTEPPK